MKTRVACLGPVGLILLAAGCNRAGLPPSNLAAGVYELTLVVGSRTPLMPGLDTIVGTIADSATGDLVVESHRGDSLFGRVVFPWTRMGLPLVYDTVSFSGVVTGDGANLVLADNVNEGQLWLLGVGSDPMVGSWQSQARNTLGRFVLRRRQ